jgi:hypothetical protein
MADQMAGNSAVQWVARWAGSSVEYSAVLKGELLVVLLVAARAVY